LQSEKLALVEKFSELKSGMLVVVTCLVCQVKHRAILIRFVRGTLLEPPFDVVEAFTALPAPQKHPRYAVSRACVADKIVYRVVDGLEKEHDACVSEHLQR